MDRQLAALHHFELGTVGEITYYDEMEVIGSHATLRRLWINEGKRRGYELVNA